MMRRTVFHFTAAILAALTLGSQVQAACVMLPQAPQVEAELLAWINAERAERGLSPYRRSAQLDKAALGHACDMAKRGYFAHSRADGPGLKDRLLAQGYRPKSGAENLAYSRRIEAGSAATIWRNSPPHWKAIIRPDLHDIGLSVVSDPRGKILWVMDVARPKAR